MENSVKIKKTADGNIVTPFSGNPEYGYVILNSVENVFQNGWLQAKERTTLVRGAVSMLSMAFSATTTLPGRIAVTECTEDDIPQRFSGQFNKDYSFEENIAPFIKRAGEDGPVLMSGEKRILRFTEYDASGQQADVRVAHTNGAEVLAFNATKTGKAKL
jgi:hypothetical protein